MKGQIFGTKCSLSIRNRAQLPRLRSNIKSNFVGFQLSSLRYFTLSKARNEVSVSHSHLKQRNLRHMYVDCGLSLRALRTPPRGRCLIDRSLLGGVSITYHRIESFEFDWGIGAFVPFCIGVSRLLSAPWGGSESMK